MKQTLHVQDVFALCQPGKLTVKNTKDFVYVLDNFHIHQTLCFRLPPMHIVQIEYPYMYVQCTNTKPFETIDTSLRSNISSYQWDSMLKTINNIECLMIRIDKHLITAYDSTNHPIDWSVCLSPHYEKYAEYIVVFEGYQKHENRCSPCMYLVQARMVDLPIPNIHIEDINLFDITL